MASTAKLEVQKAEFSINSRLCVDGQLIEGVESVMVTEFENGEEVHLSMILKKESVTVTELPSQDEVDDRMKKEMAKLKEKKAPGHK